MKQSSNRKIAEILLVEDNPGDVRLMKEAFRETKVEKNLTVINDGVKALAFLKKQLPYQNATRPDMILLDLNLPKKHGQEVLQEIKSDPNLRRIPVVILTTSKAEQDILKTYDLHANCYISKPVDLEKYIKVIRTIEDFWLTIVNLPSK